MKKLQLTETELFRLREAHRHTSDVLQSLKRHSLEGQALSGMQSLEDTACQLESLCWTAGGNKPRR